MYPLYCVDPVLQWQCGGAAECAYVTPVSRAEEGEARVYGCARTFISNFLYWVLLWALVSTLSLLIIFNDECVDIKMVW